MSRLHNCPVCQRENDYPGPCEDTCVRDAPGTEEGMFNSHAEAWIERELSVAEIVSVPGVAVLLLEHYHNDILKDFQDFEKVST